MFMSVPFEKGCSETSENSSTSRSGLNSSSLRFPVGVQSMGDDSQNVRIQLAVHKYNNTLGSPVQSTSRRSLISPIRHAFFKSPHKTRGCDGESDHRQNTQKREKGFENRYEGVGNFPTVHLKKSSVLYRPIRRLKEVKVPYPELPVNRYMSHLPEYSIDAKNSPRSVLDVLQDMSRKRVHSKDEIDYSGYSSRGLGGDLPVNDETLCRPLFVQKPKVNAVLTRDSMTQTFSPQHSDTSSIASSVSSTKLDSNDPKAELRRKLAKQNNEIFASLSSSLTSKFAMKRKIDKISATKEDRSRKDSASAKKAKLQENQSPFAAGGVKATKVVNGVQNSLNHSGVGSNGSTSSKLIRNGKMSESSATSPNKDRLTTIYLDMESSTSPKAQIFQNFETGDKKGEVLNGSLDSKSQYSSANGTQFDFTTTSPKTNSESSTDKNNKQVQNVSSLLPMPSNNLKTSNTSMNTTEQLKLDTSSPTTLNFNGSTGVLTNVGSTPISTTATTTSIVSTPAIVTGMNIQFGIPKTSAPTTISSLGVTVPSSTIPASGDTEKGNPVASTAAFTTPTTSTSQFTFTFGSNNTSIQSSSTSTCTFSIPNSSPSVGTALITSGSATVPSLTNKPVFSFGSTNVLTTTAANVPNSQSSGSQDGSTSLNSKPEVNKSESPWKIPVSSTSTFTFSANNSNNIASTSTTTSLESPSMFTFGQKPVGGDTLGKEQKGVFDTGQFKGPNFPIQSNNTSNEPSKSVFPTFGVPSTTTSSQPSIQPSFSSSLFSNNTTVSVTTNSQGGANSSFVASSPSQKSTPAGSDAAAKTSETSSTQQVMPFTFGQKSNTGNQGTSEQSGLTKVFSFGQPPTSQSSFSGGGFAAGTSTSQAPFSSGTFTFGTNTTAASTFGQSVVKSDAGSTTVFGQNSSQAPATSEIGQVTSFSVTNSNSAPKVTSTFESKPGIFGSVSTSSIFGRPSSTIFGQGSNSISSTGTSFTTPTAPSPTNFGATTAPTTAPFGTSGFETTSGFGVPATTQTTMTFGAPKTMPASMSFGVSSSSFSSVTTTASIGGSSGFGAPASSQSGFSLNPSTSQIPSFGQSFGQNKSISTTLGSTSTNIFNTTQSSTSSAGFTPSTNTNFNGSGNQNVLGGKTNTGQEGIFGQETKSQNPSFGGGSAAPAFGTQNKFTFGASSGTNGLQTSLPKTTASSVFTFGANTPASGSGFSFGSTGSTTSSSNASTPFNFNSQNTTFKFGSSAGKESTGFNSSTPTFTFGAQQNNNNISNNPNPLESKPSSSGMFNFGSNQPQSSGTGFNFGSNPQSSVFSFGSSSSGSSNSTFNFGTPQPGDPFAQATPSPGFSAPGTFSIGSGSSSQSRPRASSRLRRRP